VLNNWCHSPWEKIVNCYNCLLQTGAVGNEAQQVRAELDKMEEDRAAHSDEYPIFQLIPKEMMINKGKNMKLLPNDMGQWHTKVSLGSVGSIKST
jgi:hypothetical protein